MAWCRTRFLARGVSETIANYYVGRPRQGLRSHKTFSGAICSLSAFTSSCGLSDSDHSDHSDPLKPKSKDVRWLRLPDYDLGGFPTNFQVSFNLLLISSDNESWNVTNVVPSSKTRERCYTQLYVCQFKIMHKFYGNTSLQSSPSKWTAMNQWLVS